LAIGALTAARALDLSVPDDLSLVGFDDVPLASWTEPTLTTVRQPHLEKGQRSADLLLALLRGETQQPLEVVLPANLVIRASTESPRGRGEETGAP
jgi:LacI family transcriptional regulator